MNNDVGNGSGRLDSWKAIAAYLARDERTVRRWERDRGLPVRRVPGGRGTSVFAYTSEIDAWLKATESPAAPPSPEVGDTGVKATRRRAWRWVAAAIAVLALGMTAAWRVMSASIGVEQLRVRLAEDGVSATAPNGSVVWRYAFPPEQRIATETFGTLTQVSGGSHPAVFAAQALRVLRADESTILGGQLFGFSPAGHVEHTFEFDDHATFDGKEYGPPWVITTIAVDDHSGSRRIAVAAHHFAWSASMVTILDDQFHRHGTYWQWGWIETMHWLGPDRLLIGGFNDAKNGGMVALLDPSSLNGQSPEDPGTHGYCATCGPVVPVKMAVMPRTELNGVTNSRFNRAIVQLVGSGLLARTIEVPQMTPNGVVVDVLYEFSTDLTLRRASFGGPYWELHDALHARGQLDHDRAHCPDRDGPREIQTWDREHGWQSRQLNTLTRPPATHLP